MNAQFPFKRKNITSIDPPFLGDLPAQLADFVNRTPRFKEVLETLDLFELVTVRGRIKDSLGLPVAGTTVEIWHPTKWGMYGMEFGLSAAPVDAQEQGWRRCITNENGEYSFLTEKRIDSMAGEPASLHFKITSSNNRVKLTKLYFGQNELELADPFLMDYELEERSEFFGWESAGVCEFDIEF